MSLSISPLSPLLQFLALSSVALILTALVPFTKVEESFSMQAVHDFLFLSEPKNLIRFVARVADPTTYSPAESHVQVLQRVFNTSHGSGRAWDHQHFPGESSRESDQW